MAEPQWFTAKLDQRKALIRDVIGAALAQGQSLVFTFLTEPDEDTEPALNVWEQTCDGCGKWVPTTISMVQHAEIFRGIQLLVMAGVCPECKEGFSDD